MPPIKALKSQFQKLLPLFTSGIFVALGIFLLIRENGHDLGAWFCILFFGTGCVVFTLQLLGVVPRERAAKKWKRITFDSNSFNVTFRAEIVSTQWCEIDSATAFKRDELIVDCICLVFARQDGTFVEVDEEMEGWSEFTDALPTHLPECMPWEVWFFKVVSPAFAANPTRIFCREAAIKTE